MAKVEAAALDTEDQKRDRESPPPVKKIKHEREEDEEEQEEEEEAEEGCRAMIGATAPDLALDCKNDAIPQSASFNDEQENAPEIDSVLKNEFSVTITDVHAHNFNVIIRECHAPTITSK